MKIFINGKQVMELKDGEDLEFDFKGRSSDIVIGNGNICISGGNNQIGNNNYQNTIGSSSANSSGGIKIEIDGNVGNATTTFGSILISGDCRDARTASGNIKAKTIKGNAETSSGNIQADEIHGKCSTISGNISKW